MDCQSWHLEILKRALNVQCVVYLQLLVFLGSGEFGEGFHLRIFSTTALLGEKRTKNQEPMARCWLACRKWYHPSQRTYAVGVEKVHRTRVYRASYPARLSTRPSTHVRRLPDRCTICQLCPYTRMVKSMSESALRILQLRRYSNAYVTEMHQLCHQKDPFDGPRKRVLLPVLCL